MPPSRENRVKRQKFTSDTLLLIFARQQKSSKQAYSCAFLKTFVYSVTANVSSIRRPKIPSLSPDLGNFLNVYMACNKLQFRQTLYRFLLYR